MKSLVVLCLIAGAFGEAPRPRVGNRALPSLRPARFRSQRFEIVPTTTDSPTEATTQAEGPYPPAGWRPAGAPFKLPTEVKAPADTYGAPIMSAPYPASGWKPDGQPFLLPQKQSPPAASYGAPDNAYGSTDDSTTTDSSVAETTENLLVEKLTGPVEVQRSVGTYYILLPNGQLQKVQLLTENDVKNMRYSAKLQLRDRAPLYLLGR
ncbi:unnamed protein product, partial [Iphiclides podalirius]